MPFEFPPLFYVHEDRPSRICEHFAHNESEGCGNPKCWKYDESCYDKMVENKQGLPRAKFESITITQYLEVRRNILDGRGATL